MQQVDFEQEDGTHIRNVISEGAGGEADLYMTYMFEFALPHIEEGSEDAEKEEKRLKGVSSFRFCFCCIGGNADLWV
jgi:hypothetical protein